MLLETENWIGATQEGGRRLRCSGTSYNISEYCPPNICCSQSIQRVKVKVSPTRSCLYRHQHQPSSPPLMKYVKTMSVRLNQNNIRLIQEELAAESDCSVLIQRALTLLLVQHSGERWNIENLFKPNSNLLFSIYRNLIKKTKPSCECSFLIHKTHHKKIKSCSAACGRPCILNYYLIWWKSDMTQAEKQKMFGVPNWSILFCMQNVALSEESFCNVLWRFLERNEN